MTLTTTEELKHLASSDNANELTRRLARECLANREAQPVAELVYSSAMPRFIGDTNEVEGYRCWIHGETRLVPTMEQAYADAKAVCAAPPAPAVVMLPTEFYSNEGIVVRLEQVMAALAVVGVQYERKANAKTRCECPAPAVPGIDELRLTFERSERESDDGFNLHKYGIGYADEATQARWESWLACRAAMLAQPVSGGYKLPEGWKLVPVEPTAEMINAALASGALSIRSAYRLMLAAAPEGGE